jgi:hypothetical protein
VELGLPVDVAEEASGLYARGPRLGVDEHAAESGHVERQAPVGQRGAAEVVAAAADREREPLVASELHRGHDVRGAGRLYHEGRRLLDQAVPEERRLLVAVVTGGKQLAAQALT